MKRLILCLLLLPLVASGQALLDRTAVEGSTKRVFPIPLFPGYAASLFEYDLILVPAGEAYTVKTLFLQRTEAPSGGETVTAFVRNATGGGGSGFSVSLTGTATENSASGTLEVSASETLYLRVTAGESSLNLSGWVEVE